ncbi:hypothetical protein [Companilactobacillus insicii]|uniref:hypothetical protein n=1 Tax=Companilactobacillus insicii TaxID=1732567 RepID=UPI000F7B55E5|nr:hypothetical protein [Companilactobacillus insicii]
MLQVELVPYHHNVDKEERKYVFTENLNMSIDKLERDHKKVIDVDFFNTKDASYAAIKYKDLSFSEKQYLVEKEKSRRRNLAKLQNKTEDK